MEHFPTLIIGAGQCGLAMSSELSSRGVEHAILERGQVGNSWRTQRWDSLKLLTPNWMNRLPGTHHAVDARDQYYSVAELCQQFDSSMRAIDAPVRTGIAVRRVSRRQRGYLIETNRGNYSADNVVMANGACAMAKKPAFAADLPSDIKQITPLSYKRPDDLPKGGVLVVGASATGVQLAREAQRSGRQVMLATSGHTRVPRTYRGQDIFTWLALLGLMDARFDEVDDLDRLRRTPSLQLVADEEIDLNLLQEEGVEAVGRYAAQCGDTAYFSGGLANQCTSADLKMHRLLTAIDTWLEEAGLSMLFPPAVEITPTRIPGAARLSVDLIKEGVETVLWATGFEPDFSWLDLPVFDRKGRLIHDGGYVAPGLFALGLPYMRTRKSTFINGAASDAAAITDLLLESGPGRLAA